MPNFFFYFFFFFLFIFFLLAVQVLDIMAGVRLDFFHATDLGSSKRSEEKYMKYVYNSLGLVGVWYQSEVELPVISG